jgi:CubicO group peptidase (beta-lactamase class C family)
MGVIGDIGLRPRDMLKFGLLYLNEGVWQGKPLVPKSWVRESTRPHVVAQPGLGYGYFWWTKEFSWKNAPVACFFAWGYGGQYIFVIPDARLVIVMSGSHWTTSPEGAAFDVVQQVLNAST